MTTTRTPHMTNYEAERGINSCPNSVTNLGSSVLAALIPSGIPGVPPAFQDAMRSGHVRQSTRAGTCSCWTSER